MTSRDDLGETELRVRICNKLEFLLQVADATKSEEVLDALDAALDDMIESYRVYVSGI